jgi:hypothetical protein
MIPRACPLLAALFVACGVPGESRTYANGDLELVTAYTAKAACTCLFVVERTEEECRAFVKQNPAVASFSFDAGKKTVTSNALAFWGARARFVSERAGCVLE